MERNYIIFVFIVTLFSTLCFASETTLGPFLLDSCADLTQECGTCTYVNITSIKYPNSSIAVSDVEMDKTGTHYNYTFCNTTVTGRYIVSGVGDVDGIPTVFAYDFNVNRKGNSTETNLVGVIIGFLIIITFFIIMGYIEKFWFLQWASYALAFIELIFMLGVVYLNEMGAELSVLLQTNFYIMALIGFGLIIITIFFNAVVLAVPEEGNGKKMDRWASHMDFNRWER